MHCNKVSFHYLLECFDNDLRIILDEIWSIMQKNLQEILNRIMQRFISIITSVLI